MKTCPFCQSETSDDTTFCGQCGRRLFNPEETFTDSNVTRISGSHPPDSSGTTIDDKTAFRRELSTPPIICLSCNTVNPPHASFCRNCGALLERGLRTPTLDMSEPGGPFAGPFVGEEQAAAGHVPMVQGTPPGGHVPRVEGTPPTPAVTPESQGFGQGPPSSGQGFAPGQAPSSPASRPTLVSSGQRRTHRYSRRTVLTGLAATVVALVVGSEVAFSALFRKQPSTPSSPSGVPPTTTSSTTPPTTTTKTPTKPSNPSGVPPTTTTTPPPTTTTPPPTTSTTPPPTTTTTTTTTPPPTTTTTTTTTTPPPTTTTTTTTTTPPPTTTTTTTTTSTSTTTTTSTTITTSTSTTTTNTTPSPQLGANFIAAALSMAVATTQPRRAEREIELTIGMATYNDFDGVYFTLQALRLYQDLEHTELLVIDSYGCPETQNLVESWLNAHYILAKDAVGTAAAKELVFQEARGHAVLCCDCHVLFAPGVIAQLKQYYREHPACQDLLQGPLLYDDGNLISTHFEPCWRGQMWGIWASDPRGQDPRSEPFEIPMQGMGVFSCRKSAWLGFHPGFRGFGGEEGYIHEKFRQAGRRCLCLPWFRWMHRFSRPSGVRYPVRVEDKLRNYVLGHAELGLDLIPVLEHFSQYLPQHQVMAITEQALGRQRMANTETTFLFEDECSVSQIR